MMRRIALLIASLLLSPAPSRAAETCRVDGRQLSVDDVYAAFPEIDAKLRKGLAVTIVHEAQRASGGGDPHVFGCKVYFDLWDEAYGVSGLKSDKKVVVKDRKEVSRLCNATDLPWTLGAKDAVDVTTHLDPVSDEQMTKTRQWLAERGISNSGAFFGRAAYAIVNLKQQRVATRRCGGGS